MSEFIEFPKIARLSRESVITEKIDGTNACIVIEELEGHAPDGTLYHEGGLSLRAGSRTRWITPVDDNFGFAKWAYENRCELLQLGPGRHFGEWWGSGIQRGYNLPKGEKRFSLFNTIRWCLNGREPQRIITGDPRIEKYQDVLPACCGLVPELHRGIFDTTFCQDAIENLARYGSIASPGFMNPEGIVVFHVAANFGFKKTIKKDEVPKGIK